MATQISWVGKRRRSKTPVRTFRMTASSFFYDEQRRQLLEYEMYFKINRKARDEDVVRIRGELERKGRRHFRDWLVRHLRVHLDHKVEAKFEWEYRAKTQVEQYRASVRRYVLFRVDRRWEPMILSPGTMRFVKRPMKRRKKRVKKRGRKYVKK